MATSPRRRGFSHHWGVTCLSECSIREAGIPTRQKPFAWQSARGLWKDVADELCALRPALDNDLSVMKGFEFRPMTNANDGRMFELLGQQFHQLTFTLRVECGGCFVQHDYILAVEEGSRKSSTLFFPAP